MSMCNVFTENLVLAFLHVCRASELRVGSLSGKSTGKMESKDTPSDGRGDVGLSIFAPGSFHLPSHWTPASPEQGHCIKLIGLC